MDGSPPAYTIDFVQKTYLDAKDAVEAMAKRHAAELAHPLKVMEVCKSWMLDYLIRTKQENAKTEHGTCFLSSIMSTTVDPDGGWAKVLEYVIGQSVERALDAIEAGAPPEDGVKFVLDSPYLGLLNRSVNKTAVKELLDQAIEVPGVKITHLQQVNVRRS